MTAVAGSPAVNGAAAVAVVALLDQVLVVRPRSRAHLGHVGLEIVGVIALLIVGVVLLAT
jgi:hypothetical protein